MHISVDNVDNVNQNFLSFKKTLEMVTWCKKKIKFVALHIMVILFKTSRWQFQVNKGICTYNNVDIYDYL